MRFFGGRITVIRPLIYVPAKELARHAGTAGYPPPPPCPHGQDANRKQVEAFLRSLGRQQGSIRANLWRLAHSGERWDPQQDPESGQQGQ